MSSSIVSAASFNSAWLASHASYGAWNSFDTLITLDGSDTILLKNVAHSNLSTSDFIVHA